MASLVDWDLAARTAQRIGAVGTDDPQISPREADHAVSELYRSAALAADHVAEITRLTEPPVTAATRVVDRKAWIETNTAGMSAIMDPLVGKLTEQRQPGRIAQTVGSRVTGTQVGALLAFLSGKVLGQFEFFAEPGGQLMLVAPNVVAIERSLGVLPVDFRLWVCLHEVTHRVQFTAVPWMKQHMRSEVDALGATLDTDPGALRQRFSDTLGVLTDTARGKQTDDAGAGIMGLLATPEQRAVLERVTAFMSLVEGHAEWVMNAVDDSVIPTQSAIEGRFASRRKKGGNPLDRLLRKLLGLDAKTRQYVDGAKFVRTVVDLVGVESFNTVWTSPETLPTKAEIADPTRWVGRVLA
ncbi:zinc-dependent metalloprotease [Jatrophihabitans sp. YIM 134969]